MNGSYYHTPIFTGDTVNSDDNENYYQASQNYSENVLRKNIGRKLIAHTAFPSSNESENIKFTGMLDFVGSDHLVIRDPNSSKWYLIFMSDLTYLEFDEKINY